MDFAPTYKLESKAYPEVTVVLRRLGPKTRSDIELKLAEIRARQRELTLRFSQADDRLKKTLEHAPRNDNGEPDEAKLPLNVLQASIERDNASHNLTALVRSQIYPAYIKAAVKAFQGEINYDGGQPYTADVLCEAGPDDLFDEIADRIFEEIALSQRKQENLGSATTSGAQAEPTTSTTTAPLVSLDTGTSSEIAVAISPI